MAMYLQHLAGQAKFKSAAEEAVNALAWVHGLTGINFSMNSPIVQETLQGLKRILVKPITKEMIER